MTTEPIILTTDGSGTQRGNPGGWACVLRCGAYHKELSGGCADATNNLMELEAVSQGLAAIRRSAAVITIRTDSQNVIGWCTGSYRIKDPAIHARVTRILAQIATGQHVITWQYVPGHAGDPDNERCDQLAGEARKQWMSQPQPQQAG